MLIDCHSHTIASLDCDFCAAEMLSAAQEKGLSVFAITDHCELDEYEEKGIAEKIKSSIEEIKSLKNNKFVKVLCGIEIGQANACKELLYEVLKNNKFDMILGSLHCIKNEKDFYYTGFDNITIDKAKSLLDRYFDELVQLCEMNFFDTLAHITYPFRYIKDEKKQEQLKPFSEFDEAAKKVYHILIQNQKALEYNISSTKRSNEDFLLNKHFFELYFNEGGRIVTIGSDAHKPNDVGASIAQGMAVLKGIGFENITYYEKRHAVQIKI